MAGGGAGRNARLGLNCRWPWGSGGVMQCTGSFSGVLRMCVGDWTSSGRSEIASLAVVLCYGERRSGTAARRCCLP
jgi:hypothetical protein